MSLLAGGTCSDGGRIERALGAVAELVGCVPEAAQERLRVYASLVGGSARRLSLMSRAAAADIGAHLVDSAALLAAVDPHSLLGGGELADLGSGAGLPGVVLAILRPDMRVVAVDSRNSRVVFLKEAQRELALANLEVVHERVERLRGRRQFDLAVSRALGSITTTLAPSLGLLANAGQLVLYKGPRWPREQDEAVVIARGCGCELGWVRQVELPRYGRATWFVEFHVEPRAGEARPGCST